MLTAGADATQTVSRMMAAASKWIPDACAVHLGNDGCGESVRKRLSFRSSRQAHMTPDATRGEHEVIRMMAAASKWIPDACAVHLGNDGWGESVRHACHSGAADRRA